LGKSVGKKRGETAKAKKRSIALKKEKGGGLVWGRKGKKRPQGKEEKGRVGEDLQPEGGKSSLTTWGGRGGKRGGESLQFVSEKRTGSLTLEKEEGDSRGPFNERTRHRFLNEVGKGTQKKGKKEKKALERPSS